MLDAERFRATFAVYLPLRRVVAFLTKVARTRRDLPIWWTQQPLHHGEMTSFQRIVRLTWITVGVFWKCFAPLADSIFEVFPTLAARQRDGSYLINISTGGADADATAPGEDGFGTAPVEFEGRV